MCDAVMAFSAREFMQAQRAAERGADADVDSAKQQLAAAQLELEAAMQEQNAIVSMSNQVCSRLADMAILLWTHVEISHCGYFPFSYLIGIKHTCSRPCYRSLPWSHIAPSAVRCK